MNVRIKYNIKFPAAIYYNNNLIMVNYDVNFWMMTNSEDPEAHSIAYERIKYFLETKMHSTIFIDGNNVEQCKKYIAAGIPITTLPADPIEQIIGIMLHYKLTSIMEGQILIGETEVSSDITDGITYLHSNDERVELDKIPDWWLTPDLVHYDTSLYETGDVVDISKNNVWRELNLGWPTDEVAETTDDNVGNVVFAEFKKDEN